jgi:hypothetical protein
VGLYVRMNCEELQPAVDSAGMITSATRDGFLVYFCYIIHLSVLTGFWFVLSLTLNQYMYGKLVTLHGFIGPFIS